MFRNFSFENLFLSLLAALVAVIIVFIGCFVFAPKFTKQYSLGNGGSDKEHGNTLTITKEIDWCQDDEIVLDRNITYIEAVRLVDSLNRTLK